MFNSNTSDIDDNDLQNVVTLCPLFNGILAKDIKVAEKIIISNQLPQPPMLIDLTLPDSDKNKYRFIEDPNYIKLFRASGAKQKESEKFRQKMSTMMPT